MITGKSGQIIEIRQGMFGVYVFLCLSVFFWQGDIFQELLEFTTKATSGFSSSVPLHFFFLKNIYLLVYLGCAGSQLLLGFSLVFGCGSYSLVVVCWLLIAVASLAVKHRFWGSLASVTVAPRLQSAGSVAVYSMWDLPGSGIEPMSPALIGEFFTTEAPLSFKVGLSSF